MGHAKALLSLDDSDKQFFLHELILRDQLSVRESEEKATKLMKKAKKQTLPAATRDFYLEQLAEKIQHKLGTKVTIQGQGKKGRISIDYYNLDDLDRLLELFEFT
jgi:ParB family chromosome partitioning protein